MRIVLMKIVRHLYLSSRLSSQLLFIIYLEGYVSKQLLYPLFIREVDLNGHGPFLGDFVLKWSNSSRHGRNFCQNPGSHQETVDK